jgi:hypothetical protein
MENDRAAVAAESEIYGVRHVFKVNYRTAERSIQAPPPPAWSG